MEKAPEKPSDEGEEQKPTRLNTEPSEEFVKLSVLSRKVVMFSKSADPYCLFSKKILSKYKIRPEELLILEIDRRQDVGQVENHLAFICKSPDFGREVPRLFIGGRYFGGWKEIYRSDESGDLEFMLQQCRALIEE